MQFTAWLDPGTTPDAAGMLASQGGVTPPFPTLSCRCPRFRRPAQRSLDFSEDFDVDDIRLPCEPLADFRVRSVLNLDVGIRFGQNPAGEDLRF